MFYCHMASTVIMMPTSIIESSTTLWHPLSPQRRPPSSLLSWKWYIHSSLHHFYHESDISNFHFLSAIVKMSSFAFKLRLEYQNDTVVDNREFVNLDIAFYYNNRNLHTKFLINFLFCPWVNRKCGHFTTEPFFNFIAPVLNRNTAFLDNFYTVTVTITHISAERYIAHAEQLCLLLWYM